MTERPMPVQARIFTAQDLEDEVAREDNHLRVLALQLAHNPNEASALVTQRADVYYKFLKGTK